MYVPATPALAGPPTASTGILASEAPAPAPPVETVLHVGYVALNVLDGRAATVAGALLVDPRGHGGGSAGAADGSAGAADGPAGAADGPAGAADGPAGAVDGRIIDLQARRRHGWRTVASTRTGADGRYRLRYRTHRLGSERLRVSFAGATGERRAERPVGRLNVYRLAEVSWYGGGGNLACGGWLTSSTLGVANKTLPCGTLVTLRYGRRTVRVRVIDRGPYVAGREFDLTEATKRALGFEAGVGEVWATN
jgi:hypothetical protein